MTPRRALSVLVLLAAALVGSAARNDAGADGRAMQVDSMSVPFDASDPDAERFGALRWIGGLELVSDDADFGGYSGLVISPDGNRILAVSDRGMWMTASLVYEDGRLHSLNDARTAPILSPDGLPLTPKRAQDAEGLAPYADQGPDGPVLLALERDERILAFPFGTDRFASLPELITLPSDAADGPNNKELEAVGRFWGDAPLAGTVLALSERLLDDAGNIVGWLLSGGSGDRLTIRRIEDFDITDLAVLPGGDVLVLERKLSSLMFTSMRIRRIAADTITPGAVLDGPVLLRADQPRSAIDNMEAIAVHRTAGGETRLTLMSDDNFNPLQRTLLMQFALDNNE